MPVEHHSRLGASGSSRWLSCPGSYGMEAPFPDESSEFAREGTAAHELAEICLVDGAPAEHLIGLGIEVEGQTFTVDADMAANVQVYADAVLTRAEGKGLMVEQRFDLSPLNPPIPMFGTADAVIWDPATKTLEIWDLKYGRGVGVEVPGNTQLMYYALGAMLEVGVQPAKIITGIVQPRYAHEDGPVRSHEYTFDEIKDFMSTLLFGAEHAVEVADDPAEHLHPGDHCRFCKASAVCPAQAAQANELALAEWTGETVEVEEIPPATSLTSDQMLAVLDKGDAVKRWIDAVHDHALELALEGNLPGWKAIEGRSNRRWTDEEAAETFLAGRGLKKNERTTSKVLSPAQAEAALKRTGYDVSGSRRLGELITKPQGKPKLARADHKAPAITRIAAEDEFAGVLPVAPKE